LKYPINVVPLHDCVPLVVDSSKIYSFISLSLKPEMWQKVAKFKGAEYLRKKLSIVNANHIVICWLRVAMYCKYNPPYCLLVVVESLCPVQMLTNIKQEKPGYVNKGQSFLRQPCTHMPYKSNPHSGRNIISQDILFRTSFREIKLHL
jgi:hypothetical protein